MNSETLKQLGEPSNDMEREIFEYLTACSCLLYTSPSPRD